MRVLAVLGVVVAGFVVGVSPAAPASEASCGSQITAGGHHWIVAATVPCSVALPVARSLATARVTGQIVRRGIRIITFSSPPGWTCATPASNPRGRGCSRGVHDTVTLVELS
jgi:hypothetical protein